MWLVVKDDGRMEQIVKQVRKLHDVLDVQVGHGGTDGFSTAWPVALNAE